MVLLAPINTRRRNCPGCGSANDSAAPGPYSREQWDILECPTCGFVYMRTVPVVDALSETLAWEVNTKREAERRKREQPILDWIDRGTRWRLRMIPRASPLDLLKAHVAEGPVLDVGCGSGIHFANLPQGMTPFGVEVSKGLSETADTLFRTRGGYVVHAPAAEGLARFPDRFFAGAFLRSYLEHDADAHEVLKALRGKMRPGGVAIVKVPNYGSLNRKVFGRKWCGFRWPDHVNYFTLDSLKRMAERAGYSVRYPFMLSLPTDDNMVAILKPA